MLEGRLQAGTSYPDYGLCNLNYRFGRFDKKGVVFIYTFGVVQILTLMDKIVKLDHVDHYNRLYGLETLHPLVSIVDLTKVTRTVNHIQMTYGIYALFLKQTQSCDIKFEQLLDNYFQSELPMHDGLPSVKYFADKICLSPNYFGDMVKKETGRTPQEHIREKVIELAKGGIVETEKTVSRIVYLLGFQYPQHLCRLFKKRVGCTPNEYRMRQARLTV